ncbi:pectate lyase [Prevotella sp. PINT]|jgi:Pectate lyase|uniref:pectate lyase family protein n=1 Tax=Palleniella intestinalis TaxID=2736291 RepID=UPI0015524DBD|nr:pectate lyase [Palleniella intestinalis]NPD81019.1 pectate lyase [Palleniella intestinalis]
MLKQKRLAAVAALFMVFAALNAQSITIKKAYGWLETAIAEWNAVEDAASYEVVYSGEGIENAKADNPLIRQYAGHWRADIPGLKAGNYSLFIKALDKDGAVMAENSSGPIEVKAHTREGWAFAGGNGDARTTFCPGGYNMDGTPKVGAKILYVTAQTANTVTTTVKTDSKGTTKTVTGICNILEAVGKGYDHTPLIIRWVGQVKSTDIAGLKDGNFVSITGSNSNERRFTDITIEGVGNDASFYGYGVTMKRTRGVEIRNLGIMLYGDDGASMDTDNSNIWIHNCDFFYGSPGSDADQVKGDGSIDMKYNSTNITVSYCHFWDSGKVMGCGGSKETVPTYYLTVAHNWFDHTDSRCPRLHYATAHVYNNYYDGVSVYGLGNTTETSAFVEGNYFRNCPRPMMTSGQGTDKWNGAHGTFSGQTGGVTKAYNNYITGAKRVVYQNEFPTDYDAWLVSDRKEKVPESEAPKTDMAYHYSNFDTAETMYSVSPLTPEEAMADAMAYAGRCDGGDLKWTFDNSVDDANHDVNTALKAAITNYKDGIISILGETASPDTGEGGEDGGDNPDTPPTVAKGGPVAELMAEGTKSGFVIVGDLSNSKGSATIDGVTYSNALKMGSSASVTFSIYEPMVMTLYFVSSEGKSLYLAHGDTKKSIGIDATNIVTERLESIGEYKLTKKSGESYLVYIALSPIHTTAIGKPCNGSTTGAGMMFNINGQKVNGAWNGIMIIDGKKFVAK